MGVNNLERSELMRNIQGIKNELKAEKETVERVALRHGLVLLSIFSGLAALVYFKFIPEEITRDDLIAWFSAVLLLVAGIISFCSIALDSHDDTVIANESLISKLTSYEYAHSPALKKLKESIKFTADGAAKISFGDAFEVIDMELIELHRASSELTKNIDKRLSDMGEVWVPN